MGNSPLKHSQGRALLEPRPLFQKSLFGKLDLVLPPLPAPLFAMPKDSDAQGGRRKPRPFEKASATAKSQRGNAAKARAAAAAARAARAQAASDDEMPPAVPLNAEPHSLAARAPCGHCGALMWPSEGAACCAGGKHVLGPDFNPPIDADYLRIMQQPHFSHDSRLINAALALGSQCTAPSRAMGGLGFHEQHYAHLSLLGTTYLVLRNPHAGNNAFDNFLLPWELLLETATHDLGKDYAARLLGARDYLHVHHPMAMRLRPVADVPAERIDFSSVIRLEANSTHRGTGACEQRRDGQGGFAQPRALL